MATEYEVAWRKLTLEWGKRKIEEWHKELEAEPLPSEARQQQINADIEYMGRLMERLAEGEI